MGNKNGCYQSQFSLVQWSSVFGDVFELKFPIHKQNSPRHHPPPPPLTKGLTENRFHAGGFYSNEILEVHRSSRWLQEHNTFCDLSQKAERAPTLLRHRAHGFPLIEKVARVLLTNHTEHSNAKPKQTRNYFRHSIENRSNPRPHTLSRSFVA